MEYGRGKTLSTTLERCRLGGDDVAFLWSLFLTVLGYCRCRDCPIKVGLFIVSDRRKDRHCSQTQSHEIFRGSAVTLQKNSISCSFVASTMAKAKKRRKEEVEETDQNENAGNIETTSEKKPKKKSRKSELDDEVKPKKQKKSSTSTEEKPSTSKSKSSHVNSVHMDSLQSIFATKDSAEGTFTLFGGDLITDEIPETVPSPPVLAPTLQPSSSQSGERKPLYFFPHFESPERNSISLFPVSEEPFFHARTEYANLFQTILIVVRRRGGFGMRGSMS